MSASLSKNQNPGPVTLLHSSEGSVCSHCRLPFSANEAKRIVVCGTDVLARFKLNYFVEPQARTRRKRAGRQKDETKAD